MKNLEIMSFSTHFDLENSLLPIGNEETYAKYRWIFQSIIYFHKNYMQNVKVVKEKQERWNFTLQRLKFDIEKFETFFQQIKTNTILKIETSFIGIKSLGRVLENFLPRVLGDLLSHSKRFKGCLNSLLFLVLYLCSSLFRVKCRLF